MKVNWSFFGGLIGGFIGMLAITAGTFWLNLGAPTSASKWASDINKRKLLLAARTPSPKLLLVGGSATLFGFSAREIQNQTGYPTINLATHAALGPNYILYMAREVARPGDTVLLTFEYELYNYGKIEWTWADALMLDYVVSRDPTFFGTLTFREQWNVFMLTSNARLVRGLKGRSRPDLPPHDAGVYVVENINDWGDQTQHSKAVRPDKQDIIRKTRTTLAYPLLAGLPARPLIASFCDWARAHQIRVLAAFPNLCDQAEYHSAIAEQNVKRIRELFASLQVPVIGEYTDSLRPADEFFDTTSHLTEEAMLERSRRLAEQLKPYLAVVNAKK